MTAVSKPKSSPPSAPTPVPLSRYRFILIGGPFTWELLDGTGLIMSSHPNRQRPLVVHDPDKLSIRLSLSGHERQQASAKYTRIGAEFGADDMGLAARPLARLSLVGHGEAVDVASH